MIHKILEDKKVAFVMSESEIEIIAYLLAHISTLPIHMLGMYNKLRALSNIEINKRVVSFGANLEIALMELMEE